MYYMFTYMNKYKALERINISGRMLIKLKEK